MQNKDVRRAAAAKGIRLWQLAEACGMADTTFSKLLRRELPQEKKQEIFAIIDKVAAQGSGISE